jgi:putative flippase GtrA
VDILGNAALRLVRRLRTQLSFVAVGICATISYFIISNGLILLTQIPPPIASLVGYCTGILVSFFGQSRVTFLVSKNNWGQFIRFLFMSLIGALLSYEIVHLTSSKLGLEPIWGTIMISVSIPLFSFVSMRYWVFRK